MDRRDRADDRSSNATREPANADRLSCWKEIAAHLGVTVRTAQRWERLERLPVHRQMHATLGSAYGFRSEIDAWRAGRRDPTEPPRNTTGERSIAVLPFANVNRDLDTEILADGVTEEQITALSQVPGLRVLARTSVFHFKNRQVDVRAVGAALGVDTVLEGSVRRAAGRIRVVAELVDAHSGLLLWSEAFEGRRADVFGVQQDLAHAVAGTLRTRLCSTSRPAPPGNESRAPSSARAYDRYLEGRYHWNQRTPAGFLRAVECLEAAVAEDPGLAPAWSALAGCHASSIATSTSDPAEARESALRAARIALDLDPTLADGYVILGGIEALYSFDWARADAHFRRALELAPGLVDAHFYYAAFVLAPAGRLDEADEHQALASRLDPLSAVVANGTGMLRLIQRRYDESAAAFRMTLDLDPGYPWAHRGLGLVLLLKGRYRDALEWLEHVEMPALVGGLVGYGLVRLGRDGEAREHLRRLELSGHPSVAYQAAILHLALDDADATFEWLERACAHRSIGVIWLPVDPIWDPVRNDPRFARVIEAMGLDPAIAQASSNRARRRPAVPLPRVHPADTTRG